MGPSGFDSSYRSRYNRRESPQGILRQQKWRPDDRVGFAQSVAKVSICDVQGRACERNITLIPNDITIHAEDAWPVGSKETAVEITLLAFMAAPRTLSAQSRRLMSSPSFRRIFRPPFCHCSYLAVVSLMTWSIAEVLDTPFAATYGWREGSKLSNASFHRSRGTRFCWTGFSWAGSPGVRFPGVPSVEDVSFFPLGGSFCALCSGRG